jgi:UDP-2,3-diacylglucosamine hydrolase
MRLLVLSDLHLGPDTKERSEKFMNFLESAQKNGDSVLIVGDLFDLWFGWPGLTMEYQRPILARMKGLYESGLQIDYVEGNRDFGISQLEGILFRKVAPHELQIRWNGKAIHAEHGDLINEADRQYRVWRSVSKNSFLYFLLRHLPAALTVRLALKLERGMRGTNQKHKMYYPEESAKRFFDRVSAASDIIIVGHFHCEKRIEARASNRNVLFFNLPGWEQGFRYLVIPSGQSTPYFTDWGNQNGNSATA